MVENIWTWILGGIIWLIMRIMAWLPEAQTMINFITPIVNGTWLVLELAYMAFGNFNLTIVFASFAVSAIAWTVALTVAIVAWVKRLLKLLILLFG